MTPDTPTTATAAMSELLAKHPIPWTKKPCVDAPTLEGYEGVYDANGVMIDDVIRTGLCDFILAAVNATGTGERVEYWLGKARDSEAHLQKRVDELESALAAAREQHGALERDINIYRDILHERPTMLLNRLRAGCGTTYGITQLECQEILSHVESGLAPSQPTPDAGERQPPAHAFEVRISIGGEEWDYVVRTLDELSKHIPEHGPTCGLCSGGAGGSHSVTIHQRDVTPEQYHVELHQWLIAHKASKEAASPLRAAGDKPCDSNKLCDPEFIGSELDPHEQRCRKCGILRAAGGGGER